jgi:hypothetical protein
MRGLGMLVTLVIICMLAVFIFRASGLAPSNDHDADYYYSHQSERADKLKWCYENPQQQDSGECKAAVAAQTRVDVEAASHQ